MHFIPTSQQLCGVVSGLSKKQYKQLLGSEPLAYYSLDGSFLISPNHTLILAGYVFMQNNNDNRVLAFSYV